MIKNVTGALKDIHALQRDADQLFAAVLASVGTDTDVSIYLQDYWPQWDRVLDGGAPTRRQLLQHAFDAVSARNDPTKIP